MKKFLIFMTAALAVSSFCFGNEDGDSNDISYEDSEDRSPEYYQEIQEALDDIQRGNSGSINPGLF